MKNQFSLKVDREKKKRKFLIIMRTTLLVLILVLISTYIIVGIIYNGASFSITLDKNLYYENNIIIYDDPDYKVFRTELIVPAVQEFDNISYKWLPEDIYTSEGSNNGENYIAYSFFVENMGDDTVDYWSEIVIVDDIKNISEAVRVRVYKESEYLTYAKMAGNGKPEEGTIPFRKEDSVALDHIEKFGPGDKLKYTIVIWLEGDDLDCTDNLLGGEIKIQMKFNSEFVEKKRWNLYGK